MRAHLPLIECCTPLADPALTDREAEELERLFRALGDRHRVKILNVLMQARGAAVCVCEFVPTLGLAQPTVSYHLKQLADAGLVERERRGTFAYYRLVPGAIERLTALVSPPAEEVSAGVRRVAPPGPVPQPDGLCVRESRVRP